MLEKTRIISKKSRMEGISTRKDQRDNYIRISSNARREGRYIGWTGLTQVKDRQPGNRVFQSLVGRAPRSIRGSRPNYAALCTPPCARFGNLQGTIVGRSSVFDVRRNFQPMDTNGIDASHPKLIRSGGTSPTKLQQVPTRHHRRGGSLWRGLNHFGEKRLIQSRFNLDEVD